MVFANAALVILLAWTELWTYELFSLHFFTGSSDERPEEMDTGALPGQNDDTLSQVQELWAFFMNWKDG